MATRTNIHQNNRNNGPPKNIIPQSNALSPTRHSRSIKEKELEDEVELMKDRERNTREEMRKLKATINETNEKRLRCPGGKNKESTMVTD